MSSKYLHDGYKHMKSPKSKISSVDKLETVKDEDSASGGKISNFNEYQHIYT